MAIKTKVNLSIFFLAFIAAMIGVWSSVNADTGWEGASRIEKGFYVETQAISVGTGANVLLGDVSKIRPDWTCRNNSSFTLYIGSNTAGTTMTGVGFPILTNETFELGAFIGSVYGLASGGTVDVRCWTGKVN